MFINQVDGSGKFYTSQITGDSVTCTDLVTTNLITTTFSPVNINASTIISNQCDIDIVNSNEINTSVLNSQDIQSTTGTINVLVSDASTIGQLTTNHLILPSNSAFNNAEIITLNDIMRINGGIGNKIGLYIGNTQLATADSNSFNLNTIPLKLTNLASVSSKIEHVGNNLNFIGDPGDVSGGCDLNFFTNDGAFVPKLSIKKDTDTVHMIDLNVTGLVETNAILADGIDTTILSATILEGTTCTLQTVNATTLAVDNQFSVLNSTGKKFAIEHVSDNVIITGSKNNNSVPSNINFHCDAGAGTALLKINKNGNVETLNLHTNALSVNDGLGTETLFEVTDSGHIYSKNQSGTEKLSFNNQTGDLIITGESTCDIMNSNTMNSNVFLQTGTQSSDTQACTQKSYVDTQLTTKQNTIIGTTDLTMDHLTANELTLKNSVSNESKIYTEDFTGDLLFLVGASERLRLKRGSNLVEVQDLEVNSIIIIDALNLKQDELTAGSNITIVNDVISASSDAVTVSAPLNITTGNISVLEDSVPTASSTNLINSGNLFTEFATKQDNLTTSSAIIGNSLNIDINGDNRGNIGRASVGFMGWNDVAAFGHRDHFINTGCSLFQNSLGGTILNCPSTQSISFRVNNVEKMTMASNGSLGIGTASPIRNLHVVGQIHSEGFRPGLYGNQSYQGTTGVFEIFQDTNNTLTFRCGPGTTAYNKMYLRPDNNIVIDDFTGQHRGFVDAMGITDITGRIVSANKNKNISITDGPKTGIQAITLNETLPCTSISLTENDKAVFGVVSAQEDPGNRFDTYGTIEIPITKELGDTRYFINSVGEGAMWICNKNGVLESGDYITSAGLFGYGMKQNDDLMHNYTVAKITMDCDFNPSIQKRQEILKDSEGVNILDADGLFQFVDTLDDEYEYLVKYIDATDNEITKQAYELNGGFICALVGVTYHCG